MAQEEILYKLSLPRFRVKQIFMNLNESIDWGLLSLGIPEIWSQTRGEDIKIAVLDTGVDYQHPDLADAIDGMEDFTGSNTGPYDLVGHGTHCCGILGARENDRGIIGVAPKCRLYMGKILDDTGNGKHSWLEKGIYWALEKDVDIISLSIGSPVDNQDVHIAIKMAIDNNKIIIAAAGNEGTYYMDSIYYPAKYEETIAVGSINRNQILSNFSSVGYKLDIVAPGEDVNSCYPPRTYALLSGTSMATPFVAGVAALILAKHRLNPDSRTPCKNQEQMRQHLTENAIDLGQVGYDRYYGFGLINPRDLLGETRHATINISQNDLTADGLEKLKKRIRESIEGTQYATGKKLDLTCNIEFDFNQNEITIEIYPKG